MTIWTFVGKVMSLIFNILSRSIITFLPRSKHLLILWLQSPSTVKLEPKKIKSVIASTFSPSICHEAMGPGAMIFIFQATFLRQHFHSLPSLSSRGSLVPLCCLPLECYSSAYLGLLLFLPAILIPACKSSSPTFSMIYTAYLLYSDSLVAQMVKHLPGFNTWVGKILWKREWQPTPVFLPGESHDRGAWWTRVHGITKSQTWLRDFHFHSTEKLNKDGDNIQPWHTPVRILNQSVVPCLVLTFASCPAYRFLRRQVRWSGIPISLRIFHILLWSTSIYYQTVILFRDIGEQVLSSCSPIVALQRHRISWRRILYISCAMVFISSDTGFVIVSQGNASWSLGTGPSRSYVIGPIELYIFAYLKSWCPRVWFPNILNLDANLDPLGHWQVSLHPWWPRAPKK